MKKIYIAVVLLVAVAFTGFLASIFTGGVNAETQSRSSQFEFDRHLESVNTTMDSDDYGFQYTYLSALYGYQTSYSKILGRSIEINVAMPYIAGYFDYWADASTSVFNSSGTCIGADSVHKDYPTGTPICTNLEFGYVYTAGLFVPKFYRATTYPTAQDYSNLNNNSTYFWQIDACPASYNTGH